MLLREEVERCCGDDERCEDAAESRALFPGREFALARMRLYWHQRNIYRSSARNYTACGLEYSGQIQGETRAKHLVLLLLIAGGWDCFPGNAIADSQVLRLVVK